MAANSVARPRAAAPAGRRCSALRRAAAAAPRQQTRLPSSSLSASLSVDDAPVVQPVEAAQWREYEKAGWVLLDVRPAEEVAVVAPLRSVNVPLYISDPDRSPGALLRQARLCLVCATARALAPHLHSPTQPPPSSTRQAITWYATFAWWSGGGHTVKARRRAAPWPPPRASIFPFCACRSLIQTPALPLSRYPSTPPRDTHQNREFLREVGARVPKAGNPGVVVACQQGLRSLKAAEELVKAGYPSVAWLAGGFDDAQRVDFDTTTGKSMALGGVGGLQGAPGGGNVCGGPARRCTGAGGRARERARASARVDAGPSRHRRPAPSRRRSPAPPPLRRRPAGVLGWTKAQSKEEGGGFAGGVQNVLLAVAFVGFLDVLSLGYQLVFNQVTPPPAA